ncbi:MAG: esterase [Anaerolinea sp.]|nr:esterase [Anaerolinea sp.]
MNFFQCNFQSRVLYKPVLVNILLPPLFSDKFSTETLDEIYIVKKKYKTLFLLHGAFSDHTGWLRKTNIEKYAEQYNLAVVMPDMANSFYANLVHGPDYWTFVSEELPRFARRIFPLSAEGEDNFVAGLSMGGYGAFKLALNKPEQYAAAISLSGVMDVVSAMQNKARPIFKIEDYFGSLENFKGTSNDLHYLLKKATESGKQVPRLYIACGTEDELFPMNREFMDYARSIGAKVDFEEGPGGHDWTFWDHYIQRGLEWLFN